MNESKAAADYAVAGESVAETRLECVDLCICRTREEDGGQKKQNIVGSAKAFRHGTMIHSGRELSGCMVAPQRNRQTPYGICPVSCGDCAQKVKRDPNWNWRGVLEVL
jgi:hypothetical protein